MAEIFQNREQIIKHVGIYIAQHRKQFSCIARTFEHPIAGVQRRSMWLGLKAHKILLPKVNHAPQVCSSLPHPLHLTTDPSIPDSHIPGVMTTTIPDVMETTNGPISPAQIGAGVEAIRGQRGWLILVRGADYRRGDDLLKVISPRSRTLCSLVLSTQESKERHQHSQPFKHINKCIWQLNSNMFII